MTAQLKLRPPRKGTAEWQMYNQFASVLSSDLDKSSYQYDPSNKDLINRSQSNLINFTQYTYHNYLAEAAHRLIAGKLMDVLQGKIKRLMIFAPPQHGKLLSHDTPIPTPDGWKIHGEINPGDKVLNRGGYPIDVIDVGKDFYADREIEFNDGTKIKCHHRHEWLIQTVNRHRVDRIYETDELLKYGLWTGNHVRGNRARYQIDKNERILYSGNSLTIPPYILGVWLGDGSTTKNCIHSSPDDGEIHDQFMALGYETTGISQHSNTGVITRYYHRLYGELVELGLLGSKHIPDVYLTSSIVQRLELLAGLIDTDGYVYHENGRVTISSADNILIRDITRLISSLGWRTTQSWSEPTTSSSGIVGKKHVCQLTFNPDLYIPCKLPRKINKKINPKQTLRSIKSIKEIEPVPGKCIQVDGGIYLVGDTYIPTHNSELVSVRFPAFWFGHRPDDPIIFTSYGATHAVSKAADARELIDSAPYSMLFPSIKVSKKTRGKASWKIAGHRGKYEAVGMGGPITGHGAMLGIIDDPIKNWAEAQSETIRESQWHWYRSTFRTRIWENGAIIIIMCMTGDTKVLMANGTEKPLSDIKIGDSVATYHHGKLAVSTVLNWKNQGKDNIFTVHTSSGNMVKANARHPFLVCRNGELVWVRLQNLKVGDWLVNVKNGGNGKGLNVLSMDVTNPLNAKDTATPIITKRGGRQESEHHPTIQNIAEKFVFDIDMGLNRKNMRQCSRNRVENAPFAVDTIQKSIQPPIGITTYVLTTTMLQERFEDCYATTATISSEMELQKISFSEQLSTYGVSVDRIVEIEPSGFEDVFDIQIAGTENFIANGFVSHNTRWHEDDLAGKLLKTDGGEWEVLRLPALAESQFERKKSHEFLNITGDPTNDPLGRKENEPLCPIRFSYKELKQIKIDVGSLAWFAEYQATPRAPEGNWLKRAWFKISHMAPHPTTAMFVRYWDKAGSEGEGKYTSGVLMCYEQTYHRYTILDLVRGRWSSLRREEIIKATAVNDRKNYGYRVATWVEQEPGSGGKDQAAVTIRNLRGFDIRADKVQLKKEVRLNPGAYGFQAQAEAGNIYILHAPWNEEALDEYTTIPNTSYWDITDATVGAFNKLNDKARTWDAVAGLGVIEEFKSIWE